MAEPAPTWRLACGHEIPLLEHERPEDPPRRPRMCPVCQKLRNVVHMRRAATFPMSFVAARVANAVLTNASERADTDRDKRPAPPTEMPANSTLPTTGRYRPSRLAENQLF